MQEFEKDSFYNTIFNELLLDIESGVHRESINLTNNFFFLTRMHIESLMQAIIKMPCVVTILRLNDNDLEDEEIFGLAKGLSLTGITSLNLHNNKIKFEGTDTLANALPNSNLLYLNLGRNNLGDKEVGSLTQKLTDSPLTSLELDHNNIGKEGALHIAIALPNSLITNLNLNYNDLKYEGIVAISEVLYLSNLTCLSLNGTKISDNEVMVIATALPNSNLLQLNLGENNIGYKGVCDIFLVLPLSPLISLNLNHNNLRDKEAKVIAQALEGSRLTELSLTGNKIKDGGANAIANILSNSSLLELHLEYNLIEDQGIQALIKGAENAVLNCLHFSLPHPFYTSSTRNELGDLLQNTNITFIGTDTINVAIEYCEINVIKIRHLFHTDGLPQTLQTQAFYKKVYKSGFLIKAIENSLISIEKIHELILEQLEQLDDMHKVDLELIKDSIILDLLCSENAKNKSDILQKIAQISHHYNFNAQAYIPDLINEGWHELSEKIITTLDIKNCRKFLDSILLMPCYTSLCELILDRIPDKSTNIIYVNNAALHPNGSLIFNAMLYKGFAIAANIRQKLEEAHINDPWGHFNHRMHFLEHYLYDHFSFYESYELMKDNREYEEALWNTYEIPCEEAFLITDRE